MGEISARLRIISYWGSPIVPMKTEPGSLLPHLAAEGYTSSYIDVRAMNSILHFEERDILHRCSRGKG